MENGIILIHVTDENVKIVLYILAESVAARLRENGFRCRTVEISIRDKDLFHFSKQIKLKNASNITREIAEAGYKLYKENYRLPANENELKNSNPEYYQKPLGSIGIRGTDLVTDYFWEQLDLFMDPQFREKQMKMDEAVDSEKDLDFTVSREDLSTGTEYCQRVMQSQTIRCILMSTSVRQEELNRTESSKVYVNIMAEFTKDGRLLPRSFIWKDGHIYEIQKVTDVRRAASLKAGEVGIRYTCIVNGREGHIFYEDNNMWFMEER